MQCTRLTGSNKYKTWCSAKANVILWIYTTAQLENMRDAQDKQRWGCLIPYSNSAVTLCVSVSLLPQSPHCFLSSLSLNFCHIFLLSYSFLVSYWRKAQIFRQVRYERHGIPVCFTVPRQTGWKSQGETRDSSGDRWERDREESPLPPCPLSPAYHLPFSFSCFHFLMPL